ncbi:MAG: MFS transporter [Chloroflexi bacterium]|nr:MFS transporter [Chloroflexota bacterium]
MALSGSSAPIVVATPTMVGDRRSALFLALATFLFWASLYVYVPILSVHAKSLGASLSMVGLVIGAYGISQLVLRIPLGIWSDRTGRRLPYVGASLAVAALGAVGLAMAPEPWTLFLARGLTGVAASGWVVFTVLYAGYFPPAQVPRAMGQISFVNGLAQLVSAFIGGFIADGMGSGAAFMAGAVLAGLGTLCVFPVREVATPKDSVPTGAQIWRVATLPSLLLVSALSSLTQYNTFSTAFGFTTVYAAGIGASKTELGLLTTAFFAAFTVASLGAGPLVERWGPRSALALGMALLAVGTIAIPFTGALWPLVLCQIISGAGRGVTQPALLALAIRDAAPSERATAMGVYQALYSVGMFAGPPVSGAIADAAGLPTVFAVAGAACLAGGQCDYRCAFRASTHSRH